MFIVIQNWAKTPQTLTKRVLFEHTEKGEGDRWRKTIEILYRKRTVLII